MESIHKTKHDVIVIGAGLFGSMIAKHLRTKGLEVLIIDNVEQKAGSKCSFGVWKDGWVNKKIKSEVDNGMDLLSEFSGGIEDHKFFNMDKELEETFQYVNCDNLLNEDFFKGKVTDILADDKLVIVDDLHVVKYRKALVVAAGVWTPSILQGFPNLPLVDNYYGATLDVDLAIDSSRMSQWAPYRQNVLLKKSNDLFMFGDGATVKNPKIEDDRLDKMSNRLVIHLNETVGSNIGHDHIVQVREGYRPYLAKGGSGSFVTKHADKVYSATGGAKNSTILAGHVAKTIYKAIKES